MAVTTSVLVLAAVLMAGRQAAPGDSARTVVRAATQAIERDSVAAIGAAWSARLERDSTDRAALLGLATIARLTYDHATAERTYARLLSAPPGRARRGPARGLVRPAAGDVYAAYASLGRGQALVVRGRTAEAPAAFREAASLAAVAGDPLAEAESLLEHAMLTSGASSDSLVARAAARIPATEQALAARLYCGRAGPPGPEGARLELEMQLEGSALAHASGDTRVQADCLRGIAAARYRLGDYSAARAAIDQAIDLQRSSRDLFGLAVALTSRAYTFIAAGEYGRADRDLREAVSAAETAGADGVLGAASLPLTTNTLRFGDLPSALHFASRAEFVLRRLDNRRLLTTLRGIQGDIARAAGDTATARERYLDALSRTGVGGYPTIAPRRSLASLERQLGEWDRAEAELLAARAAAREIRLDEWQQRLDYDLAALALARGDLDAAERGFRSYLAGLGDAAPSRGYAAYVRIAEINAVRGDLAAAETQLVEASDAFDAWRSSLDDRALRILAFQRRDDDVDPDLGVASILSRLAMNGRAERAFLLAEARRARDLNDQIVRLSAAGAADPPVSSHRRAEAGSGVSDRFKLHSQTAIATSHAAITRGIDSLAAAVVDERSAVVLYVTGRGGEPTTAFVLTRDGLAPHVLAPIDSVHDHITRMVALLGADQEAGPTARRLGAALLDDVTASLPAGITRLVVVPTDILHRVPWDALVLSGGQHAVERFAISLAPSTTTLAQLRARPRRDREAALLAFGDPAFARPPAIAEPNDRAEKPIVPRADAAGPLRRLRASGRETRLIARYSPAAELRLREHASAEYLMTMPLDSFRVIHFATHARIDETAPSRSGIVLAPGGEAGGDGFIGAAQLATLRLDADLVVLSACRSARGPVVGGEGVQGLVAPLLAAGARAVVATGWAISDRATVRLIDSFYSGLASDMSVGDALHAAKLDALRSGAPAARWAAFTLVGDPAVTVPLLLPPARGYSRAMTAVIALVGVVAIAAVILLFARVRRDNAAGRGTAAGRSRS